MYLAEITKACKKTKYYWPLLNTMMQPLSYLPDTATTHTSLACTTNYNDIAIHGPSHHCCLPTSHSQTTVPPSSAHWPNQMDEVMLTTTCWDDVDNDITPSQQYLQIPASCQDQPQCSHCTPYCLCPWPHTAPGYLCQQHMNWYQSHPP